MNKTERNTIKKMLDLCDELGKLRRKIHGLERSGSERSLKGLREREEELRQDLSRLPLHGALGEIARESGMDSRDLLLLAQLMRHYLRAERPYVEGRTLLNQLFRTSYEIIDGINHLAPESPLRQAGLIQIQDEEEDGDPLDQSYRVSDKAVTLLAEDLERRKPSRADSRQGYSSHAEFLADLKILIDLHWARANVVFAIGVLPMTRAGAWQPGAALTRRILRREEAIRKRLLATSPDRPMPFLVFAQRFGLHLEEQILVATLLFHELHEGASVLDVVELMKLIAPDEESLIRCRRLFWKSGRLRRQGILEIEEGGEERLLSAQAGLAGWAMDFILGEKNPDLPANADDQLDLHLFLKRLAEAPGPEEERRGSHRKASPKERRQRKV